MIFTYIYPSHATQIRKIPRCHEKSRSFMTVLFFYNYKGLIYRRKANQILQLIADI